MRRRYIELLWISLGSLSNSNNFFDVTLVPPGISDSFHLSHFPIFSTVCTCVKNGFKSVVTKTAGSLFRNYFKFGEEVNDEVGGHGG